MTTGPRPREDAIRSLLCVCTALADHLGRGEGHWQQTLAADVRLLVDNVDHDEHLRADPWFAAALDEMRASLGLALREPFRALNPGEAI